MAYGGLMLDNALDPGSEALVSFKGFGPTYIGIQGIIEIFIFAY